MIYCFESKTRKCKYWVLKVLCLDTQMMCPGWLKNDSRSPKCCIARRCNGLGLEMQTDQIDFVSPETFSCKLTLS